MEELGLPRKFTGKCHKVDYRSRKSAKAAMKRLNREEKYSLNHVYFCDICSSWHVTSMDRKTSERINKKKARREKRNNIS